MRVPVCLAGVSLVLAAGSMACRPHLSQLLNSPSTTAADILEDVRQSHSGGRALLSVSFMAQEDFHPGVGEIFYPELAPSFVGRSRYDFATGAAWQHVALGGHDLLWTWDGVTGTTLKDGKPYQPRPGVDRLLHLRATLPLLHAWDLAREPGAVLQRLGDREGNPRVLVEFPEVPSRDSYILEVDHRTGLLGALEYTVKELRMPGRIRVEFGDHRLVRGVLFPHALSESIPLPSGTVGMHTMALWDVELEAASVWPEDVGR